MQNSDKTKKNDATDRFFLPDLCGVQAVLFLVLVAELLAIVLELAAGGVQQFSWTGFALTSLFVQWIFLVSAALLCQLRPSLSRLPLPTAATACYLLIIAVVALTTIIGQWMLSGDISRLINSLWSDQYQSSAPLWLIDLPALITNIIICAVLAGITLRYFYLMQQLQLQQRTELQARIQALQSRIRPHFLFNSMNIIASLIPVDQEAAETAVEDLASLFRASLAEVATQVSLAEELALCRRYARIEQLRLGSRLTMDWQCDDVPQSLPIPSLCLQPLLENAIYHGIQQLPEGGTVSIKASYQDGLLTLVVTNPVFSHGQGERAGNKSPAAIGAEGNQLALDNIRQRLQAMYGTKASLTTGSNQQQYCACIQYPVADEPS
jgi:two-component system sensor histidine kinase AlgZ